MVQDEAKVIISYDAWAAAVRAALRHAVLGDPGSKVELTGGQWEALEARDRQRGAFLVYGEVPFGTVVLRASPQAQAEAMIKALRRAVLGDPGSRVELTGGQWEALECLEAARGAE